MTKKAESERVDIYTRITDRIVEDLEQGVRPWMKPWNAVNTNVASPGQFDTTASPIRA